MEEIPNLKNQLLKRVEKYQEEFDEIEIMNTYITTTSELKQQWENTRNSEQSICGAQIPQGELTFQCFTCAPDPHHMFCYKCFIPKQHVNHISIIKHDIGGACDCGDEQTINDKGFCQNHKGFSKVNKDIELGKIPQQLQTNVGNFIRALCHIYLPLIRKIQLQYSRFDVIAVKMYNISEKHAIQSFKDQIDGVYEIEEYYKQFQQALRAHDILFRTISKLIDERFCFILLVTKILKEKLQDDSHESIIEEIIENHVLLETQGPVASFKLERINFSFFADYTFKEFMQQVFLKKYDCLWLKTNERSSDITKAIKIFITQLGSLPKQYQLQSNPGLLQRVNQTLEDYLKIIQQKNSQGITLFWTSEILELHTQYVSEKLQNLFFANPNMKNIFSLITKNLQTIQTERVCSFSQVLQFESLILRIDYLFFDKIAYKTLQNALGQNYEIFLKQKATKEILDAFPHKDFFLTALVNSATNLTPIKIDLVEEDLTIWEEDLYDAIYYLMVQGLYVKTFQVGLSRVFSSEMCTQNLIENLNYVLIHQCYNSLKNQRNKKVSVDAELQLALEKYFLNPQLTKENIFDRMSKIYLMLIKSDTYIDKIFIILLSNIYCLKQFKTSTEFKQYLSTLLNEDINELQRQFYFILTRCLQTYTSVQYCQNQYLENIYLGLSNQQDQITMLESYDTSFFRLYIFLFEENGFADFIEIIKNRFIPIPSQQLKLLCSLILRMIGSDLDVYNVCAKSIKILPNDLKLSLAKLVSNFSNLELYQEYPKIEAQLQLLGIMISQNLPEHLLQVMEVDQSVKKLKLKPEYKPIYDPAIFHISSSVTQQIVEKFIQQEKPQVLIQLGNGIDYDVEQFSTNNYRQILKSMLQFYCKKPYIEKNLQFLNFQGQFLVQAYQLIYIQIVASNYFRKEELKNEANGYIKILTDIKDNTQRKDDILRLTVLIDQIQQIVSKKIEIEQVQVNEKSKQFNVKKNQYKAKFQQLQQKEQLQKMMQQIEQENDKQEDEENCCSCRMNLSTSKSSYLILLFEKPTTNILKMHPKVYSQQLNDEKVSLDYLGITTCQHSYHHKCLVERFESSAKNVHPELPDWVKLCCPVCKQACVFTMPIEKQLSQIDVNEFNEQLVVYLMLKTSKYIDIYEKTPTQCLILIYFNLIFDLLTNLLSSTSDFKRDKKYNVFNQLIRIFSETCKDNKKESLIKFDFQCKDSIISIILNIIFENICMNTNLQNVQIQIQQLSQIQNLNHEIRQLLQKSFYFENIQDPQFLNMQPENLLQQNILKEIEFYASLNTNIIDQLKLQIGKNFQEFYCKYFTQCCGICGFYSKDQRKQRDFSLCLLCLKCFCHYKCQNQALGNLNHHSTQHHSGNSIFVSLRTGHVTLVSSPISISFYKCLFYNSLGQQVDVQHKQKNWDTYAIDLQKLKELAFIIQNNTYQTIVRNLEVRQNQLNLNGMI